MTSYRDRLRVVLIAPRNPLNIGAAARAMSNFGFAQMRVVNAYEIAYAEAKSAVNAAEVLAQSQQYATVAEAVADCTMVVGTASKGNRALAHSLRRLEYGGGEIRRHLDRETVGLLFGSEKFGLSNDDMSHCHWLMRIPTRDQHQSMNLGQAVAVCLYELIRSAEQEQRTPLDIRPAVAEDVERAGELLLEALQLSGYVNKLTAGSTEQKVRRLVRRLALSGPDASMLQGMLRQMLWKLRQ